MEKDDASSARPAPTARGASTAREAGSRTVHLRVTGRVQGVYFRAWTAETAAALKLDGWVRNRRAGAVEMLISGRPEAVARMVELCREGPPGALVAGVEIVQEGGAAPIGFAVVPTL